MKIEKVVLSPGLTGYYLDDKIAIREGAKLDGHYYRGAPVTPGFRAIRQPGESVSVTLMLSNGLMATGDCATGQYSGIGGREKPFFASEAIAFLRKNVVPELVGLKITSFKEGAQAIEKMRFDGERIHSGMRYGLTQAILDAVAKKQGLTMAEVIAQEYGVQVSRKLIPIFIQTGDDRRTGTDKAIMKKADVLPHGLINNVKEKTGANGEILLEYAKWIRKRCEEIGEPGYRPTIHLDVYGTIGYAFNNDLVKVADYIGGLEEAVKPLPLQLEMPIDMGTSESTMEAFLTLKAAFKGKGIGVKLVIDEWANTLEEMKEWADSGAVDLIQVKTIDVGGIQDIVEAVLYCNAKGVGAYLGGTCNETDVSARVCANVAMATSPSQMLAKPGMAVDESMMIIKNEMSRVLEIALARE